MNVVGRLLLPHLELSDNDAVAVLNADEPGFVRELAGRVRATTLFHRDVAALDEMASQGAGLLKLAVSREVIPRAVGAYDAAILFIPKERQFSRALLYGTLAALRTGGSLYGLGANAAGGRTAVTDVARIAEVAMVETAMRHRLFRAVRPHDIALPADWEAALAPAVREVSIRGRVYRIEARPGVFSWDHLDDGSALLIEALPQLGIRPGGKVLDAGCGSGIVGMVVAAEVPGANVTWCDKDLLAVECARRNTGSAAVLALDLNRNDFGRYGPFDTILCNPPFHRGQSKDLTFMSDFAPRARGALAAAGTLVIVANRFLPYVQLLKESFRHVSEVSANGKFKVIASR